MQHLVKIGAELWT